ncbi:MAG: hypothetical protein KGH80_04280 [Xanthomonadaceae bacterium]|nr:hypothetical protein [Xanthomonadaceae bacterium]
MSFVAELRRRNVLRAAVLYIGAVWALAQGIAQLGPPLGAPDWIVRWFVIAACIAFPFWLAFAWFYEWTPQGLRRESEIAANASIVRSTGRKLDRAIIVVLAIAVVMLLTEILVPRKTQTAEAAAPGQSVAVLPFVNMSGDAKNDYFSDGITEEILNALAQVPNLKVAARTSAFAFKGREGDLRKIADTLDVATVLEGGVQKSGEAVRITAQLIDTRSGFQLWSEKYDRKLDNVFAVEDEISRAIADKLRVQSAMDAKADQPAQVDTLAHDFYLRGLAEYASRGPSLRDAVGHFQKAVAIAPNYADAWAALAEADVQLPNYDLGDVGTSMASAQAAAKRALSIDPNNAAAHVALGVVYLNHWQWEQADDMFRRAMHLAPGDAEAIHQRAYLLLSSGNLGAALQEIDRALERDPLSPVMNTGRGEILYFLHRNDDAWTQIQSSIAAHPDFALGYYFGIPVANATGHMVEMQAYAKREAELSHENVDAVEQVARGVVDPAQRAAALRILGEPGNPSGLNAYAKAHWYCLLGDRMSAIEILDQAMRNGINPAFSAEAMWSPLLDPVRNEPRFKAMLRTMNLPYTPKN